MCVGECKLPLSLSLFICLVFHPDIALMQALPEIIAPRTGYTPPPFILDTLRPCLFRSDSLLASCLRHFSRRLSCTKCNTFDCTHAQVLWPKWLLLLLLLKKKNKKLKSRRKKARYSTETDASPCPRTPRSFTCPLGFVAVVRLHVLVSLSEW